MADVDMLSAAFRHLRDARYLVDRSSAHRSFDQAFHLAGFAPECIRKAALSTSWLDQAFGHDFGDHAETVLEIACALQPMARRYALNDWQNRYPLLSSWHPRCRYQRSGSFSESQALDLVVQVEEVVMDIAAALFADGRIGAFS